MPSATKVTRATKTGNVDKRRKISKNVQVLMNINTGIKKKSASSTPKRKRNHFRSLVVNICRREEKRVGCKALAMLCNFIGEVVVTELSTKLVAMNGTKKPIKRNLEQLVHVYGECDENNIALSKSLYDQNEKYTENLSRDASKV